MKIECPQCGKKFEIPLKHRGRKFRCIYCHKKIRTPAPTEDELRRKSTPKPPRYSKIRRFKKSTDLVSPETDHRLKVISTILFLGGLIFGTLLAIEYSTGFFKNTFVANSANATVSEADDNGASGTTSSGEPIPLDEKMATSVKNARKNETSTKSGINSTDSSQNSGDSIRPDNGIGNDESGETVENGTGGLPQTLSSSEVVFQTPILGGIPDFDPTWPANNPNHAYRTLLDQSISGMRMEKFVRVYGSPTFIRTYQTLRRHSNYSIRFYAALALANYGKDVDESLETMIESIAMGNANRGALKLRVDLANEIFNVYQERATKVLHKLVRYKNADIRGFAIENLANIGPEAKPSVQFIAQALRDKRVYKPQSPHIKASSVSDIAFFAMNRLQEFGEEAVPVIMSLINESDNVAERVRLRQLALRILAHVNRMKMMEQLDPGSVAIGMRYIPKTMRYVFHYRPSRIVESEFFIDLRQQPEVNRSIELLEKHCHFKLSELDMVTVAYMNQAPDIWHKKPLFLIARTNESLPMERFSMYRAVRRGEKRILQVAPDLGVYIAGDKTLVLATMDDLVSALDQQTPGPPNVTLPTDLYSFDFFYSTSAFSVAGSFANQKIRLKSEFEYFVSDVAEATLQSYRDGVFDFPTGFPMVFAKFIEDQKPPVKVSEETEVFRLKPLKDDPKKNLPPARSESEKSGHLVQRDSRLIFITETSLDALKRDSLNSQILFLQWLSPEDSTARDEWKRITGRLDISRAPYTDAAGLVTPKLGEFNDLERAEVVLCILKFFEKVGFGPTTSFDFSGEESANVHQLLKYAARWSDSRMIQPLAQFLNAANFSVPRKVTLLSNVFDRSSLSIITDYIKTAGEINLEPETLKRLKTMVQHFLANGEAESQLDSLVICEHFPEFATELQTQISEIAESKDYPDKNRNLARELQRMTRAIRFNEGDFAALENVARDSGLANFGLENHRNLKGTPPKVKSLEAFTESNRIFDIELPFVDPDLEKLQLDGNVDAKAGEYSVVTGFKYMIKNGDVIVVSRQQKTTDYLEEDWEIASRFMQSNVFSDVDNDSQYEFDRTRFYKIQGVLKAQRLIIVGDKMYEVRWIGRNHDAYPAYVQEILDSYRLRDQ